MQREKKSLGCRILRLSISSFVSPRGEIYGNSIADRFSCYLVFTTWYANPSNIGFMCVAVQMRCMETILQTSKYVWYRYESPRLNFVCKLCSLLPESYAIPNVSTNADPFVNRVWKWAERNINLECIGN